VTKLTSCPNCGTDLAGHDDGRTGAWRFRVRLYDMDVNPDEPMPGADSDAQQAADQPGATVARGLWKVAGEAAEAAQSYHGASCLGMSMDELDKKIRGLRPTLSRNKGRGTMRVQYDTQASFNLRPDHTPRYLARVDIVRETESANV
jgi:hypothetical protein